MWLELGSKNGELRLVNYLKKEHELPKTKLSLKARVHLEVLPDGSYQMSWTNVSPGPIVSAELANEEVWRVKRERR